MFLKRTYILTLLFLASCATGPKLDSNRAKKIKKVAIVAFHIDQEATGGVFQDGDLAQKSMSSSLMGGFSHKGQVIFGDYADEVLKVANSKIEKILGWKSVSPETLKKNNYYRSIERKLSKNILTGKSGAPKGYLRYGVKDLIFAVQLYNIAPKYEKIRKNLARELNVDAVALLTVGYDIPTDGIGIGLGNLAKFESGDYKPKVTTTLSIYDHNGYVGRIESKEKSNEVYTKENLKEGLVKAFNQSFAKSIQQTREQF